MNKKIRVLYIFLFPLFLFSCSGRDERIDDSIKKTNKSPPYFQIIFNPDIPGCGNCHNNPDEREYSLAAKANEKWEDHKFNINGKMMTINDCLLCHSVEGPEAAGTVAPESLRTIVHQTHMSSGHFEGNCFTCHYIRGESSDDIYNYSD